MSECDDRGRATSELRENRAGRGGARRGRALLAASAAFIAAVALGFPGSGCLNPRPEELPSADFSLPNEPVVERETCEDNPLLAACELPDQDINGNPIDRPDPSDSASPDEVPISSGDTPSNNPAPSAPGSEAAGAAGGAGGDAGSDIPADAGAP